MILVACECIKKIGGIKMIGKWTEEYKKYLESRLYASATIKTYTLEARLMLEYMKNKKGIQRIQGIDKETVRAYTNEICIMKTKEGKKLSKSARSGKIKVMKQFFKFLLVRGEIMYNPAECIELPRMKAYQIKEVLKEEEMRKLIESIDGNDVYMMRNRAILELLYSTGMRNAELTNLKIKDVDFEEGEIMIRDGKGGKSRIVPLGDKAAIYLERYLIDGRWQLKGKNARDYIFLSSKHGKISEDGIRDLVKKCAELAGFKKRIHPHMIRHSCATHLIKRGAGLRHIQELLGHKNIETTTIYTKLEITDLKKIHRNTHPRSRI